MVCFISLAYICCKICNVFAIVDAELGVYVPLIRDTLFPGVRVPTDGGQEVNGSQSQHLKWQAHMVNTWHDICDGALQDM